MLIMDSVYSDKLIALGFDPQTFPITNRQSAGSWSSAGSFNQDFAQAPIGLWGNYKGYSNVGKVPEADMESITGSEINANNTLSTGASLDSSSSTNININSTELGTDLKASATDISVSANSFETNMASGTSTSVALAFSQHETSLQSDANLSVDVQVVSRGLKKGFNVSLATIQSNEYTVSVV